MGLADLGSRGSRDSNLKSSTTKAWIQPKPKSKVLCEGFERFEFLASL